MSTAFAEINSCGTRKLSVPNTKAGPIATPGETAIPRLISMRQHSNHDGGSENTKTTTELKLAAGTVFGGPTRRSERFKLGTNQHYQLFNGLVGIITRGVDFQFHSRLSTERQQVQQTFRV